MNMSSQAAEVPFDAARLDRLMDEAGLDVLLATSKHNVSWLLGGYRFIFFSAMDAIGHSRYLPIVAYVRGRPDQAAYVANRMERGEHENRPFWTPALHAAAWGTLDAAALAAEHLQRVAKAGARIGIEPAFLPADAYALLAARLEGAELVDATGVFERMRAIKTPAELAKLREASERITDAMLATIAWAREGSTKSEIIEQLRREETDRGLQFEYCLLTLGPSHNRWHVGEMLARILVSIDSTSDAMLAADVIGAAPHRASWHNGYLRNKTLPRPVRDALDAATDTQVRNTRSASMRCGFLFRAGERQKMRQVDQRDHGIVHGDQTRKEVDA